MPKSWRRRRSVYIDDVARSPTFNLLLRNRANFAFQKECAILWGNFLMVQLNEYNQKCLCPKSNADGDIGTKMCGFLTVPCTVPVEHGALSVHCAGPSLSRQPSQAMWRRVCYVKYLETKVGLL